MCTFIEEDVQDELNWLKYNNQPWTEVLQKWRVTATYRINKFFLGESDVDSFKLLLDPKADTLVT